MIIVAQQSHINILLFQGHLNHVQTQIPNFEHPQIW